MYRRRWRSADTIYLTTMDGVVSSANGVLANDLPGPGSLTAVTPQTRCRLVARWMRSTRTARSPTRLTLTAVLEHSRHSRITTTTACRTAILRRQPSCVGWRYRSASCVQSGSTCNWDIRGDMETAIPDGTVVEARLNGGDRHWYLYKGALR